MASTTTALLLPSSGTKHPSSSSSSSSVLQCATLPPPPLHNSRSRPPPSSNATAYCRTLARNVAALATGEAPAATTINTTTTTEVELPELVKTAQQAWNKIEDKYAVVSLGAAGVLTLWTSAGMISAIDRLPLVPGVLELVGIGYTSWFAYRNLVFKPDREALFKKIKSTYNDILGSSS